MDFQKFFDGDLYDAYKRLVIREKVVLEETIDLLKRCRCL